RDFADWAFAHRDGGGVLPTTQSQPLQMMGYWYQQAASYPLDHSHKNALATLCNLIAQHIKKAER
ncbi:hypothetical protein ACXWQS_09485, partial [Streptococcus pyogenes]